MTGIQSTTTSARRHLTRSTLSSHLRVHITVHTSAPSDHLRRSVNNCRGHSTSSQHIPPPSALLGKPRSAKFCLLRHPPHRGDMATSGTFSAAASVASDATSDATSDSDSDDTSWQPTSSSKYNKGDMITLLVGKVSKKLSPTGATFLCIPSSSKLLSRKNGSRARRALSSFRKRRPRS
jgi:hypothetical protein